MKYKKSILIPDGESPFLILVLNCLSSSKDIKIYIMSNKRRVPPRYSRYVYHFSYYKPTETKEWINLVNKEVNTFSIDVIMPVSDIGFKALVNHRDLITETKKLVVLPSLNSYKIANDKWLLSEHLAKNNIPLPKSFLIESNQYNKLSSFHIPLPCLLKPAIESGGGKGIIKFETINDLEHHINNTTSESLYIQEFINGYDLGCNVLCYEGKIIALTIQKGYLWDNKSFSAQIGLEFLYEENVYQIITKLMDSLQWSGVANIDLIYDESNKVFKVLEINSRFWMTVDASCLAGVNFPYLYSHMGKIPAEFPKYKHDKYLNFKGLIKSIKKDIKLLFKFKFIWNNTSFKFIAKDPMVMTCRFLIRTKIIIARKLKIQL